MTAWEDDVMEPDRDQPSLGSQPESRGANADALLLALLREALAALASEVGNPAEAGRLAVAVSGGSDSVALASLLAEDGVDIVLLHVDHGLRHDSAEDEAFVRAMAAELGLPFASERLPVAEVAEARGWNLEDAARRLRREALHRMAKANAAKAIALAHTLEDQAETVLLQAMRGAAHLRGMAARSGRLIRPLLSVERGSLRDHLLRHGRSWREDPSNADLSRSRAYLRHEVLPRLRARWPDADRKLARLASLGADNARGARAELGERLRGAAALAAAEPGSQAAKALAAEGLETAALLRLRPHSQREAVALLLTAGGLAPDLELIEAVRAQFAVGQPWRRSVADGVFLRIAYGRLALEARGSEPLARALDRAEDLPADLDPAALLGGPLVQRGRQPGDRVSLPGGHRTLTDLLVDLKVPRERREALALVARDAEVLWADGLFTTVDGVTRLHRDPEHDWMGRALELARSASRDGEVPVGAVVVVDGEVVGEGANQRAGTTDPSAHAEVLALRRAAEKLGDWRLPGATLLVTLEPCMMCLGAMLNAQVARVVYGAINDRDGALGGVADVSLLPWKQRIEVRPGLRATEAGALLSSFFQGLR